MSKFVQFLLLVCVLTLVTASSYAAFIGSTNSRDSRDADTVAGRTIRLKSLIANNLDEAVIQVNRSFSEPTTMFLLGTGLVGIAGVSRKKTTKRE